MPRLIVFLVVAVLLPVPAAVAQSNPFGPLPPANPVEQPTPEDTTPKVDDGKVSKKTLLAVGLGVILVFGGIGFAITRDARRSLTEDDRAALDRDPGEVSRKKSQQAKAKARQKVKAQRKARRHNR